MASSINEDTLSMLNSSQFDDLPLTEYDRLDAELQDLDESTTSRKCPREQKAIMLWSYARPSRGIEKVKNRHGHKVWYCGQKRGSTRPCTYSTTTLQHARKHLMKDHLIMLQEDGQPPTKRQASLTQSFEIQRMLPSPQFTAAEKELLR